jgi:molybdopterin molybdotransferase
VTRSRQREQAVRVRLERRDGTTLARVNGAQGSHMMSSLLGADALALIPAGEGELAAGDTVALTALPR